jgi:site-specific DNA recombinase
MKTMTKAALYARVSSDGQKQERTIESQVAELKRQIAAAGHQLVKEYIDDGYSGAYLDVLGASTTDTFDVVYFLCADRIAREAIHQNIIVAELAKHKKRIVISGKEHEENPEHKLTLQVLGAVSEFERAPSLEKQLGRHVSGVARDDGGVDWGFDPNRGLGI